MNDGIHPSNSMIIIAINSTLISISVRLATSPLTLEREYIAQQIIQQAHHSGSVVAKFSQMFKQCPKMAVQTKFWSHIRIVPEKIPLSVEVLKYMQYGARGLLSL